MNLATQSEGIWPAVPIERGHLFRSDDGHPVGAKRRWDFLILTDPSVSVKFLFLSHGSSFQLNSVSIVNQSVQDGIGDGRVPDMIMPVFNRELTGDQGGTRSITVFDDFEQVSSFRIRERG